MTEITCFDDLVFRPHRNGRTGNVQAYHKLSNGLFISVVGGDWLYGDGINSFEIACFDEANKKMIKLGEFDEVLGWQSKDEVTQVIQKILDKC